MRMLCASVNLELHAHCTTERVLGEHALYCVLDNALGMLLHGLLEGFALQAAGITAVTIVFLAGSLNARDLDLVSVDDYDEVAGVNVRRVGGLVLTLENMSGLRSDATKNLVLSVDEKPFALNFVGLCVIGLHSVPPIK